jgi:hypothetical protein
MQPNHAQTRPTTISSTGVGKEREKEGDFQTVTLLNNVNSIVARTNITVVAATVMGE